MTYIGRKLNFNSKVTKEKKTISFRQLKSVDYNTVDQEIRKINITTTDSDKAVNDLNNELHKIINTKVPIKKKTIKYSGTEKWVDTEVLKAINRKNKIEKQIRKTRKLLNDNNICQNVMKEVRNQTNKLIKEKKKNYYYNKIIECGRNSCKLRNILKTIVKTKSNRTLNKPGTENSANEFNNKFITEPLKIVTEEYGSDIENTEEVTAEIPKFEIPQISAEKLSKIVSECKTNISCGNDMIAIKFIKIFKSSLI